MRVRIFILLTILTTFNFLFAYWEIYSEKVSFTIIHEFDDEYNISEEASFFPDDPKRLINVTDFHYILQQEPCTDQINGLILIISSAYFFERRQSIRETWFNKRLLESSPLRVLFLTGAVNNEGAQKKLILENQKYGDIVQGSFLDTYRNLTYKHVMALKWFLTNCNQASGLIKIDDDVFLNTPKLLEYAKELYKNNKTSTPTSPSRSSSSSKITTLDFFDVLINSLFGDNDGESKSKSKEIKSPNQNYNFIFCDQNHNLGVIRSFNSKWRVSYSEYSRKYYPPYCLGYIIFYPRSIIEQLYVSASRQPYFWIDDVHMTGTIRQLQRIDLKSIKREFILDSDMLSSLLSHKRHINQTHFLFNTAWRGEGSKYFKKIWKLFEENNLVPQQHVDGGGDGGFKLTAKNSNSESLTISKSQIVDANTNYNNNDNNSMNKSIT